MSDPRNEVRLQIRMDADAEELEHARAQLERELLEVGAADRVSGGPTPVETLGIDPVARGTFVVAVGRNAIGSFVGVVRSWVSRRSSTAVKLELDGDVIELTGVSREEQNRLVEAFLARNQGSSASARSGLPGDPDTDF
jgi:hypothetical protein